jgi:hypothetical protein
MSSCGRVALTIRPPSFYERATLRKDGETSVNGMGKRLFTWIYAAALGRASLTRAGIAVGRFRDRFCAKRTG